MIVSNQLVNTLRNRRFWYWDHITGSNINSHLGDVNSIQSKPYNETFANRNLYLNNILQHAVKSCQFYYDYHNKTDTLEFFPVINKNIVRDHFTLFLSEYSQPDKDKVASTSGSTGTPFQVLQNKQKVIRNTADNLYFYSLVGYSPGDPIYYFRFWNAFAKKSVFLQHIQNITPIDVFEMDDHFVGNLLSKLNKTKSKVTFLGYSSAFARICEFIKTRQPDFQSTRVNAIIAISESLDEHTRKSLKRYFGVDAVSRYSNVENGIIAQELPGKRRFIVNKASYHVEILSESSDEPVETGKTGRIVVTDFFNKSLPLIRYDTGDLGSLELHEGKLFLKQVLGRVIDQITNTDGERLRGNIALIIHKYKNIKQCQIIQKGLGVYTIKLNVTSQFNEEKSLLHEYREYLGQSAKINIEYVEEIPRLASGKMRVVANETHGN